MASRTTDAESLLTPAEVAALFRVDPKTVTRWAKAGKAHLDPHAGRPPPLPRGRGARPARGHPAAALLIHPAPPVDGRAPRAAVAPGRASATP
ncbi:hypothetical protein GCM10025868_26550 [Angustibacter aerolatus]|uniref:Helix-turn-helix domain-containing protein n=1 Tax=Angustibacter aerolatus TaxID=1162965 RepID=A0ABQ6JGT3_9ACTN|nr:hypothetical protein GCM10025868_26550 [Angustibacter aerolatus]